MDPDILYLLWRDLFEDLGVNPEDDVDVDEIVALAFERKTGLRHLGSGVSRSVFEFGDGRVLKLSISPYLKYGANQCECGIWITEGATPAGSRWLAPVLDCASDGSWLIMERAEPASPSDVEPILTGPSSHSHELAGLGVEDWRHHGQWGRIRGDLKLVDYGSCQRRYELESIKRKLKR
jgi:hypothetical protein